MNSNLAPRASIEEQKGKWSEADYGIASKSFSGEPSNKIEMESTIDISEAQNQHVTSEKKPQVEYVEDIRRQDWTTKHMVGAERNLSPTRSSSEKRSVRLGFWQRRWRHYKRYWILYTIGLVVLLAIILPIL